MYKHYLVTRFNIKKNNWREKVAEKSSWSRWMYKRVKMFEKYCLPSVLNQTTKNFKWIICIDTDTTNKYTKYFDELDHKYEIVNILEVPNISKLTDVLKSEIKSSVKNEYKYIVTTRLDNDDCIDRRYMGKIQDEVEKKNTDILSMEKGYQLLLGKNKYLREKITHKGPFMSMVEDINKNKIETIYDKGHPQWNEERIRPIKNEAYWLQIIHGDNLQNDESSGKVVRNVDLSQRFGVEEKADIGNIMFAIKNLKHETKKFKTMLANRIRYYV